jgi:hypothetical protein
MAAADSRQFPTTPAAAFRGSRPESRCTAAGTHLCYVRSAGRSDAKLGISGLNSPCTVACVRYDFQVPGGGGIHHYA